MLKPSIVVLLLSICSICAADDLEGVKCVVMDGKNARQKFSAEYMDGTVYFCCSRCQAAFDKDPEKFAEKSNYQLVATGQYEQTACPFSGKPVDGGFAAKVGDVDVSFCNENCRNTVKNADDFAAKTELVFAVEPFKQAFTKKESTVDISQAKCLMMPKRGVKADQWVDYLDGKVYFCCEKCKAGFSQKQQAEEVIRRANEQLFATGQYEQRLCPFTGNQLDDENFVEFNGNKIRLCCADCRDHLNAQKSDDEKSNLVFGEETFKESFKKKD